ncbi:MAG: hypothetical protein ACRD2R_09415 [Terriglobales bacterium]
MGYYLGIVVQAIKTLRRQAFAVVVGIVALYVIPPADRGVIVFKAAVVTFAWVLWHILRHETFPYLKFDGHLERGGPSAIAAAIVLAATCLAVVLGIASAF